MVYLIALVLTAMFVGIFVAIEHYHGNFEKHFGAPPRQFNEDDPDFLAWVERKTRHLED